MKPTPIATPKSSNRKLRPSHFCHSSSRCILKTGIADLTTTVHSVTVLFFVSRKPGRNNRLDQAQTGVRDSCDLISSSSRMYSVTAALVVPHGGKYSSQLLDTLLYNLISMASHWENHVASSSSADLFESARPNPCPSPSYVRRDLTRSEPFWDTIAFTIPCDCSCRTTRSARP